MKHLLNVHAHRDGTAARDRAILDLLHLQQLGIAPGSAPVALRLPEAVLSLPPLAVAPSPPTEVILPALSRVNLLTPLTTDLAGGLDFLPLVPVLAKRPLPSLT